MTGIPDSAAGKDTQPMTAGNGRPHIDALSRWDWSAVPDNPEGRRGR
jgi:hypothetical protein